MRSSLDTFAQRTRIKEISMDESDENGNRVVLVICRNNLAGHISVGTIDEGQEIKDDATPRWTAFDHT
jgi:hypothetical protein